MKISERTIKRLGEIITGDKALSPYRSGPKLVTFFNEIGTNHAYGQGVPSRWTFAEDCIRQFNGTPTLKKIILSAVDPRDFMGVTLYDKETQQNKPANLQEVGDRRSKTAYHGFLLAVVHRVPNNPISVLLPDFVSHLDSR
jgi:hypothetical protein